MSLIDYFFILNHWHVFSWYIKCFYLILRFSRAFKSLRNGLLTKCGGCMYHQLLSCKGFKKKNKNKNKKNYEGKKKLLLSIWILGRCAKMKLFIIYPCFNYSTNFFNVTFMHLVLSSLYLNPITTWISPFDLNFCMWIR